MIKDRYGILQLKPNERKLLRCDSNAYNSMEAQRKVRSQASYYRKIGTLKHKLHTHVVDGGIEYWID